MRREHNRQNEQRQPNRGNSGQQSRYTSRDYRGSSREPEAQESRWNDEYDRGGAFRDDPERGYYYYGEQGNRDDYTDRWDYENGGYSRPGYGNAGANQGRYQMSGREPGGYRSEWGGQGGGARYGESDFSERGYSSPRYGSESQGTSSGSDWQNRGQQRYGGGQSWGDEAYGRQEYRHAPSSTYGGSSYGSNYGTNFGGGRGGQYFGTSDNSSPDFTMSPRYGSSYGAGMQGWGSREQGYGTGERYPGQSHAGKGPKGYQRGDDRIQEDVSERLAQNHEIDASEIEVKVSKGEVTLTGSVADRRFKRMAEDIAESVSGVKEVTNQLRISQNGQSQSEQNSTGRSQTSSHQEPSRSRTQEHELVGAAKR